MLFARLSPPSPPLRPFPALSRHTLRQSPLPSCTTGILTINQMELPTPDALEQVEGWHTLMEAGSFHSGGGSNPHEPKVMSLGLEV